jgi:hypothetical protein
MAITAEPSLQSGPPSAADWAAVSVTVASETTRHAPGAVRQAGGDELRRCRGGGGGGGYCDDKDRMDADCDDADDYDVNPDDGNGRPP